MTQLLPRDSSNAAGSTASTVQCSGPGPVQRQPCNLLVVHSFGNHDQGTARNTRLPSRRDTLHPGSARAANQRGDEADAVNIARGVVADRGMAL